MKRAWQLLFLPLVTAYAVLFLAQEKLVGDRTSTVPVVPTASFLRATTGYLQQLTAESLFVQAAVFLGGRKSGTDPLAYAPALTHNFKQMTALYPAFIDPYYYVQSSLANIGPEYARAANDILAIGRKTYPNNFILPVFQGFNLFNHLDQPLKAAEIYREASLIPKAPPIFAHLAVILSAQGGQLHAAILSLHTMLEHIDNEEVKKRYLHEIEMFRQALNVQMAADAFLRKHQHYPATLDELIPEFLAALPSFEPMFELTWNQPSVGLRRPRPKKAGPGCNLSGSHQEIPSQSPIHPHPKH